MDLNDLENMHSLDNQAMIDHIDQVPGQLEKAWESGQSLHLSPVEGLERIVTAGWMVLPSDGGVFKGINTDVVAARGVNCMSNLWTLLHFGDYTSYYLAIAVSEGLAPVDIIKMFKLELERDQ